MIRDAKSATFLRHSLLGQEERNHESPAQLVPLFSVYVTISHLTLGFLSGSWLLPTKEEMRVSAARFTFVLDGYDG